MLEIRTCVVSCWNWGRSAGSAPPLIARAFTSSFPFICCEIIARSLRPTDAIQVVRDPREREADVDGRAPRLEVEVELSRTNELRIGILDIARQRHARDSRCEDRV